MIMPANNLAFKANQWRKLEGARPMACFCLPEFKRYSSLGVWISIDVMSQAHATPGFTPAYIYAWLMRVHSSPSSDMKPRAFMASCTACRHIIALRT